MGHDNRTAGVSPGGWEEPMGSTPVDYGDYGIEPRLIQNCQMAFL